MSGNKVFLRFFNPFIFVVFGLFGVSQFAIAQSNSEPFMDKPADQNILEDAGLQTVDLTGITDNDGTTQSLSLVAVSSNQALISNSSINIIYTSPESTGTLEYTTNLDANGLVSITITLMDDGGIASGGDDTFITNFTVTVNPVNDIPEFDKGLDLPVSPDIIYEDPGPLTYANWVTNINKGGTLGNENFQNLTFILTEISSTGNFALNSISINATGTLSFTPTANTNGTGEYKIELQDNGLDTPPDINLSEPDTFLISITSVNDPPVFIAGSDITVFEGAGPQLVSGWATGISAGGGSDESGQILVFNLDEQSRSNFLTFTTPPSIDPISGDLIFEADIDASGTATYEVTLVDDGSSTSPSDNTSVIKTLNITVTALNDPPTATIPTTYDTFEDAGEVEIPNFVTDISAGSADEATSQTVNFELAVISTSGTLVFEQLPQISDIGTFSFQTSENTNGSAEIQISVFDDGPDDDPNNNVGPVVNLTINVEAINDRPTFSKSADPTLLEDNGAIVYSGWALNISPGPSDESGQSVTFQVDQVWTEGTISFASEPEINTSGDLSFETTLNTNGRAAYEIVLVDDGPTGGLNLNTSAIASLTFIIEAVNDAPVYVIGPDQTVAENSGLVTIEGWATGIGPGGGTDEEDQTYSFTAIPDEITGNLVFSIGPLVSATGDLSFQSAPNTFGSARYILNLTDDGSSVTPNVNISPDQTFIITVDEVNDPPTDIVLSNNSIQEKQPIETFIGNFTALDPDDITHTFALVDGTGADDNASFLINGNELYSNETFDFREKNLYSIRVSASDELNTVEQVFLIDILIEPVSAVKYPSAFTPNGDGENDLWLIESIEYFPGAIISIYNRNGQKVYESIGYKEPWDGNYNGNRLPVDTYYAVIKLNKELEVVNTTVTILR